LVVSKESLHTEYFIIGHISQKYGIFSRKNTCNFLQKNGTSLGRKYIIVNIYKTTTYIQNFRFLPLQTLEITLSKKDWGTFLDAL